MRAGSSIPPGYPWQNKRSDQQLKPLAATEMPSYLGPGFRPAEPKLGPGLRSAELNQVEPGRIQLNPIKPSPAEPKLSLGPSFRPTEPNQAERDHAQTRP